MESPPDSSEYEGAPFDPSKPFQSVVVCCTSVPTDQRSEIASKTVELGGIHKYDLTPDVTHLIVGEYDTPKYRHVAKQRADIKAMAAGWIDDVRALWVKDDPIDMDALEKKWCLKTFETNGGELDGEGKTGDRGRLRCCLTGFEDIDARQRIIDKITAHGGDYAGDLSRKVTHLIVYKPEGRKYQAAKSWNIHTVVVDWLHDSVKRGMILDEKCYDPLLAREEIGKGAIVVPERSVSHGKRQRDAAQAAQKNKRQKLKKSASMKFSSHSQNMWGEILGKPLAEQSASFQTEEPTQPLPGRSLMRQVSEPTMRVAKPEDRSRISFGSIIETRDEVFASCCFHLHGFDEHKAGILASVIHTLGGRLASSTIELESTSAVSRRFVIVHQMSKPETWPALPDGVEVVTNLFVERCLQTRTLYDANNYFIGRPFPNFPVEGFNTLSINTAGFANIDLLHINQAIEQLGAKHEARLNRQVSLVVCTSLEVIRKEKLEFALREGIPVVKASWLRECTSRGTMVPLDGFVLTKLVDKDAAARRSSLASTLMKTSIKSSTKVAADKVRKLVPKTLAAPARKSSKPALGGVDMSAFDPTPLAPTEPLVTKNKVAEEVSETTFYEMAPTHHQEKADSDRSSRPGSKGGPGPLSEKSASELNRSPSPQECDKQPPPRKPLGRIRSEVCDSENDEDDYVVCHDDAETNKILAQKAEEIARTRFVKIKAEQAAAERLALSTKLTTLLQTTTSAAGGGLDSISTRDEDILGAMSRPPPTVRRKRGIMGRAISNVSAASSGSAESSGGAGKINLSTASQQDDDEAHKMAPPAATQIEYEDAEAKKNKARLMSKILGTSSDVKMPKAGGDERVTMRDVRQQEVAAGSRVSRSMRKR